MWLHMGSVGPIKVDASTPEMIAGPPFRYGPNPDTLLDISDLVFIDAPTTGLSRPIGKAEPKDSSESTRTSCLHPDDPALSDQIRPLERTQFIIGES